MMRFRVMLQLDPPLTKKLRPAALSEKGVRLAQKMQVGPYIHVGVQLERLKLAQLLGQLGVFLTLYMTFPLVFVTPPRWSSSAAKSAAGQS
jgi:hypothetical protein